MELFSPQFFSALLAIIIIDLVLAGDNAIVIALAARKLPKDLQRKAIVWGTAGAIIVRVALTVVVVALLKVPGLMGIGGLLLIWIAYKLLVSDDHTAEGSIASPITGFWSAIRTIVIADAVMGLDNILGVAGAARDSFLLVILGLLISIPIMVFGSTLILRLVDRYPIVIYVGAAVLAWTAAKMLVREPLIGAWIPTNRWVIGSVDLVIVAIDVIIVIAVLLAGYLRNRSRRQPEDEPVNP
jgi:YjbE family integral membrane protein